MNVLQKLWFFLPAGLANASPVILRHKLLRKIPNAQVDFGASLPDGNRIFGDGKTFLGFAIGSGVGAFFGYLQGDAYLGFLLGFGAIFGDLIKSFFKRRFNLEPGKPWVPFDQLDFVFGALLLSFIVYIPPVFTIILIIFATPLLHPLTNRLGYYLKIKQTKW